MNHDGADRRRLLAGTLAGLGGLVIPGRGHATTAPVRAVAFGPQLEPLVRLIEETPRAQLIEAAAARMRAGTSARDLLAATFLAGVRGIRARPVGFELHCVLAVHSAHLTAQMAPAADRHVPIFWAMDTFKDAQEVKRRKGEGGWMLPAVDPARLPGPYTARQRYLDAMAAWDVEGADLAITALVRYAPLAQVRELVFRHGARDFRDIGHKAIYAAQAWRTLGVIGWEHAEPVLRSLTFACLDPSGDDPARHPGPADQPYRANQARLSKVRGGWQQGRLDHAAVRELLQGMRTASADEASQAVMRLLGASIAPRSLWDGLFLFAAELVMRHPGILALHAVTTVNALHHAFGAAGAADTRLVLLLQAAAFLALFRGELDDDGAAGPRITTVEPDDRAASAAAVFAEVGASGTGATRSALGWMARHRGQEHLLVNEARRLLFRKGRGYHDYKFSAAVFEDVAQVSSPYRERYLAANLALLSGASEPDNPLVERIRAALGRAPA